MLTGENWEELYRRFPGLQGAVVTMTLANEFQLLSWAVSGGYATNRDVERLAELREFADQQQAWIGERPSWAVIEEGL